MRRRQIIPGPIPQRWLITDDRLGDLDAPIRRLARGSGLLVRQHELAPRQRARLVRRLRRLAAARGLTMIDEAGGFARRVHDPREIARARLSGAKLLLVSPVFATRSHPGTRPLPRLRAAALARLAGKDPIALGGMNSRRFRAVKPLGFHGWAAIDAWIRT